jgi:hypothetical protein
MQELRVQNATNFSASMAVLSLTPLFQGETTQSRLLMPLLQADTVVDAIVNILDNGLSETVYLPRQDSC